jgi:plasmid replication initiation protein
MIEARFDPSLKSHYLELKEQFTQYSLFEFLLLPSTYSQRMFEILKSWADQPEVVLPIEGLYQQLDVPESHRADFAAFRRRVLEKAQKDIHKHTALRFEWEAVKNGRSVAGIRFLFAQKRAGRIVAKKQAKVVQDSSDAKNKAFIAATKCHAASKGRCTPKDNLQCQVCAQLVSLGKRA